MGVEKIGPHAYRIGRLTPKEQLHVVRRLGPFANEIAAAINAMAGDVAPNATDGDIMLKLMIPVTRSIAAMPQADVDYIIDTCLGAVDRDITPEGMQEKRWAPVQTRDAGKPVLMYQDLDLAAMLRLTVAVIRENLASFFPDAVEPPVADRAA